MQAALQELTRFLLSSNRLLFARTLGDGRLNVFRSRNPGILRLIPTLVPLYLVTACARAQNSDAMGEPNTPYQIVTAGDLKCPRNAA
jgi:hypothetical protein